MMSGITGASRHRRFTVVLLVLTILHAAFADTATDRVSDFVNGYLKNNQIPGCAVMVRQDGKLLRCQGFGVANLEHVVRVTPETVFQSGSTGKQFTAMAIMMLIEEQKLALDDPISKYLDVPENWSAIRVRHLLTHTAGLGDYPESFSLQRDYSEDELLKMIAAQPLAFPPGEKWSYSNLGYVTLGILIHKVSGQFWGDFLQQRVFAPLGMKQTGYDNPVRIIKNRAAGYARTSDGFINAAPISMSTAYAAGALYSTVGDLLLWDQALYTEKLVSRKSLDEAFTPFKSNYGYGWSIGKRFDRQVIAHGGGIFGFSSYIARYPSDHVTVIVLSNVEGAPSGEIANSLAAIAFGAPYEVPAERKEIPVAVKTLEKYVGKYQLTPQIVLSVTLENGKLLAQVSTQPKLELFAESETVFFFKTVNAQVTFVVSAQGEVTGLVFRQGGSDIPAQKI